MPVISAENACFFVVFLACETQDFASLLGYFNYIAVVMVCFYRSIIKQWGRKILRLPNKDVPVINAENACFSLRSLLVRRKILRLYLVTSIISRW
jgi:hypothetical protein